MTAAQRKTDEKPANKGEVTPEKDPKHPSPPEIGGPEGPDPTRYGDWERKGRCIDF